VPATAFAFQFHVDTHGHSDYWKQGSESLLNQARIVVGKYDQVTERVLVLTGGTREPADREPGTAPCEGRRGELSETVYFAYFNFQVVPIPEEQQLSTLRRLREHWQQQGYTVKRDRVFPDGRTGELAVENPADEYEIRVQGTDPPTAFAARVSSPCYKSDDPYQPVVTTSPTSRR
jgi:hypothetical protein